MAMTAWSEKANLLICELFATGSLSLATWRPACMNAAN
jgi:hypothetical protein